MIKNNQPLVNISHSIKPRPTNREIEVAEILSIHFNVAVDFITPRNGYKLKTADILMNGVMWEIKSPNTGNIKSIPAIIRHASKQSSWIVLDNRYTKLNDDKIIAKVQAILLLQRSIKKLIVITKSLEILLF